MNMKKLLWLPILLLCCCCEKDISEEIREYELSNGHSYFNPDIEENKAVFVESEEAFRQLFAEYKDLPPIDFKKSKLMLVKGRSSYGISELKKQLVKTNCGYELTVVVKMNLTTVITPWCIGYVLPKTEEMGEVNVTIEYID